MFDSLCLDVCVTISVMFVSEHVWIFFQEEINGLKMLSWCSAPDLLFTFLGYRFIIHTSAGGTESPALHHVCQSIIVVMLTCVWRCLYLSVWDEAGYRGWNWWTCVLPCCFWIVFHCYWKLARWSYSEFLCRINIHHCQISIFKIGNKYWTLK